MLLFNIQKEKKGVTLVEILIAFIILTVAAFGAAGLISHGHKTTRHDFRRNEATQLLVDRMNQLSTLPFASLKAKIGSAGGSVWINTGYYEGIQFGDVKIGNNNYNVKANLKSQDITFSNLLELKFPNSSYNKTKPETWEFRARTPSSTVSYAGSNYQIVKIHVQVTPQKGDVATEKTFEAVTFVCNMER